MPTILMELNLFKNGAKVIPFSASSHSKKAKQGKK